MLTYIFATQAGGTVVTFRYIISRPGSPFSLLSTAWAAKRCENGKTVWNRWMPNVFMRHQLQPALMLANTAQFTDLCSLCARARDWLRIYHSQDLTGCESAITYTHLLIRCVPLGFNGTLSIAESVKKSNLFKTHRNSYFPWQVHGVTVNMWRGKRHLAQKKK